MDHEIAFALIGVWASAGTAAWVGVKLSMNGLKASLKRVETHLDNIDGRTQDNRVAIESIKTRCAAFHP